jgi:NADPH:quinone reductase-like Zn-dependent oxidoreductase
MATMKAIRQHKFGGTEVLQYEDVPRPEPIPTEVLVRVQATSVNPVDFKTRSGHGPLRQMPFTVGWDVAGVVAQLGGGVTRFAVGDEVFGMPWFPRQAGSYAEYVTAPSRQFVRKPAGLSTAEAAALPLAGLTAWQTLVDTAQVRPGQRVLIHAAAGGVGHLAVQIAKARGAYVIGTARPANHEALAGLGADQLIDYRSTRFEDAVGDIDVVLDLIGGENSVRSLRVMRPGGLLIPVPSGAGRAVFDLAAEAGVRVTGFLVEPDQVGLDGLVQLVESGQLRVLVSRQFPLTEVGAAHEAAQHDHSMGKIVLTV